MSINTYIITSLVLSKVIVQRLDKKIGQRTYLKERTIAILEQKKLLFLMPQFSFQKH